MMHKHWMFIFKITSRKNKQLAITIANGTVLNLNIYDNVGIAKKVPYTKTNTTMLYPSATSSHVKLNANMGKTRAREIILQQQQIC